MKIKIYNLSKNSMTFLAAMILLPGIDLIAQGTLTDIDGNIYQTVTIGTQVWMKENLKTTHYRNGDSIGTTYPATYNYMSESNPKYQWAYSGNDSFANIYGRLYTGYAATDSRKVCPTGWHVPTSNEWKTLIDYLGGGMVAHGKLKESGTTHWESPNSDATNESGFTGLPGGLRGETTFEDMEISGHYWAANEQYPGWLYRLLLNYEPFETTYFLNSASPVNAWAVRCLNDTLIETTSIENAQNKIKISINPNPASSLVTLFFGTTLVKEALIKLFNLQGNLVFSKTFHNTTSATIDLTGFPKGLYVIKLNLDGTVYSNKICLE
jgi:uncharacterized protein (TIGR02145 family)